MGGSMPEGYKKKGERSLTPTVQEGPGPGPGPGPVQEIVIFMPLIMPSINVSQVLLLLAFLNLATCLPVSDLTEDYEPENFLTHVRPWMLSEHFADSLLEATLRRMLSAGLDRRRQLGDIEFSNRYSEFLRSKAKHSSVCTLLRRMQGVKKSAAGGDVEKVNQLLKQYMCPSIYNSWPTDL